MGLEDLDVAYIRLIVKILANTHNDTEDFRRPVIPISLRYVFPLFVFLYAVVMAVGTASNVVTLCTIGRQRLRDPMTHFLANIAVANIIMCLVVLPLTLSNLLIKNWFFGSFTCFFLPMVQFLPVYASMLSYLTMAVDRYRFILYPYTVRPPTGLCIIGVWVLALCLVLPYAMYVKYIDLELYLGAQFAGLGLCVINPERNIEEYTRAMFVIIYVMPLAIIAFLQVKVSNEIKSRAAPYAVVHYNVTVQTPDGVRGESQCDARVTQLSSSVTDTQRSSGNRSIAHMSVPQTPFEGDDFDPSTERRTQKYAITMVTLFAICWCPMNILTLVSHFIFETVDNSDYFDVTFLTFVCIGFLSTCVNPFLFVAWHVSSGNPLRRLCEHLRPRHWRRRLNSAARERCRRGHGEDDGRGRQARVSRVNLLPMRVVARTDGD